MTDIVKELRATEYDRDNFPRMKSEWACSVGLALRAAAEIERLREALDTIANGPRDVEKTYAELFAEVKIEARAALRANDE